MKQLENIEKKRHGSHDFPIQYYYVDEKHPQYIMKAHWHNEFEVIRVLKGKFTVYLNNVGFRLNAGDILLVESGLLHRGEPYDNVIYECIVFDLKMLLRQKNDITEKYIYPIINLSAGISCLKYNNKSEPGSAFNTLFEVISKKEPYYELKVYSLLFECFMKLYSSGNIIPLDKSPQPHRIEVITYLIDWIDKNYTEPITLEILSSISGFSKKYLCRIFKEYTSKTIINYINELRVESACYEISVKGKSITDAAYDNGFNDLSYFCRTFKQYKKVTPNEFKKQSIQHS